MANINFLAFEILECKAWVFSMQKVEGKKEEMNTFKIDFYKNCIAADI